MFRVKWVKNRSVGKWRGKVGNAAPGNSRVYYANPLILQVKSKASISRSTARLNQSEKMIKNSKKPTETKTKDQHQQKAIKVIHTIPKRIADK